MISREVKVKYWVIMMVEQFKKKKQNKTDLENPPGEKEDTF